ncbi:MAG: hypothetical protein DDT18_00113 [Actinobacteria bacterium]|nr:hypothetical protein [Actinomycetota bacterium]
MVRVAQYIPKLLYRWNSFLVQPKSVPEKSCFTISFKFLVVFSYKTQRSKLVIVSRNLALIEYLAQINPILIGSRSH